MNILLEQHKKKKSIRYPFVQIGSQYWTAKNFDETVTPMGNVIQEMQAATNVEKIVNGEFADTSGWSFNPIGGSISGGTLNFDGTLNERAHQAVVGTTPGKYYRLSYNIISTNTGLLASTGGNSIGAPNFDTSSIGIKTIYFFMHCNKWCFVYWRGGLYFYRFN